MATPTNNLIHQSYASNRSDATAVGTDETGVLISATQGDGREVNLPTLHETEVSFNNAGRETPPPTPSQRLLDPEPTPTHVQFASYPDEKDRSWNNSPHIRGTDTSLEGDKIWVPLPLRTWFWLPLVIVMGGGAIVLEILLHVSNKNQGWPVHGNFGGQAAFEHYLYTLPPVAIAAVVVAMWTWTDIEIKKMQPYVDLVQGDSPPQRSLLLDYTRTNNFLVWTQAYANKHYLVALASIMVLLSLTFQPLAAALLVVKDTWWTEPDMIVNNQAAIGLNQNGQFSDLTSFLSATGYAAASVLYELPDPPFVYNAYTIAPFDLPTNLVSNGTVVANTTALKSDPGCQSVNVQLVQLADGSGWNNSISSNGCSYTWSVDRNATTLFGTDTPNCGNSTPPQFSPVVFWFFTYQPSALASATICSPTISLWDVNVNVNLANASVTKLVELAPFSSSSNFSSLAGNVTGAPLNGRAYNGIKFNLTNPNKFVLARQAAIQLQMPASVFQAAVQSPEGLTASFTTDTFAQLSTNVYQTYLQLIAKTVYFLPFAQPITIRIKTFRQRVWLSPVIVHLLATAMFLLAFFAALINLLHRAQRRNLRLQHEPGTIASAVSIGAQTGIGELLAGRQREADMTQILQNKRFRIDPESMKIVMEGEEGYEYAASPGDRRRSIFAALQGQGRLSKRFSKPPTTPTTLASGGV